MLLLIQIFICVCLCMNPLSGSLASSIFDPLSGLVGASGGVYALMGGYFMNAVVVSHFPIIFDGIIENTILKCFCFFFL